MKTPLPFLDCFDRDCLNLTTQELRAKYPRISLTDLEESQRAIREQMSELKQRRCWRWIKRRSWALYSYGED